MSPPQMKRRCHVFPTHVGVDRLETQYQANLKAYSPRTWGWTAKDTRPIAAIWVFPTHVGVDRNLSPARRHALWYSPRTWGWTSRGERKDGGRQGIPHARGGGPHYEALTEPDIPVFPTHVGVDPSGRAL